MNVYSYVLCVLRAKISNYNAGSITLAWCMRPCRVLSRISQLTKPDLAFGLRHVARTRVSASIKTILHVMNTDLAVHDCRYHAHGTAKLYSRTMWDWLYRFAAVVDSSNKEDERTYNTASIS